MRHTHSCLNLNGGGCQSWHSTMGTFQTIYTSLGWARVTWRTSAKSRAALKRSDKKQDLKNLLTSIVTMSIIFENKSIYVVIFSQNPSLHRHDKRNRADHLLTEWGWSLILRCNVMMPACPSDWWLWSSQYGESIEKNSNIEECNSDVSLFKAFHGTLV